MGVSAGSAPLLQCREFHDRKPNVKDLVGAAYWVLVGAPVVPALYFTLFYPGPAYLLLIPTAMGTVGTLLAGFRNVWALLIGFGGLPAVWLTVTLLQQASRMTWSCSSISFESSGKAYGYGGSGREEVICETMPGQLIVAAAVFWGSRSSGSYCGSRHATS
jgi:hypothetical protein